MNAYSRVCVLGTDTLIGSALVEALAGVGLVNLVADLVDQPEYVFVAGRSGESWPIRSFQRIYALIIYWLPHGCFPRPTGSASSGCFIWEAPVYTPSMHRNRYPPECL